MLLVNELLWLTFQQSKKWLFVSISEGSSLLFHRLIGSADCFGKIQFPLIWVYVRIDEFLTFGLLLQDRGKENSN